MTLRVLQPRNSMMHAQNKSLAVAIKARNFKYLLFEGLQDVGEHSQPTMSLLETRQVNARKL